MFVLVVTGKKEFADDKAVLLGNTHHGLCLLKLEAACLYSTLCKTGAKGLLALCFISAVTVRLFVCHYPHVEN